MAIDIFNSKTAPEKQHLIYKMLMEDRFKPEQEVLKHWADGFEDRDGKFIIEFQTTFESSFWELYLYAVLKELGCTTDMQYHTPDFVVEGPFPFGLEAAIARPEEKTGKPAFGYSREDLPDDFTDFNIQSTLRICNSFDSKIKRYRNYYSNLPHMQHRPYIIAIASFDRPAAHLASTRPILAALYGLYHDEAATNINDESVVSYNVYSAPKTEKTNIPVGLFCDNSYPEVSAVIYSCLATWGKVRALADNPDAQTTYTTFHPNENSITPTIKRTLKINYTEHLMDGLFILHNPYATNPIPKGVLSHPRVCEINVAPDGELLIDSPEDFLLIRMLNSSYTKKTKE
ncbi:glycosaminoglycan attachment site [Pseudomonas gingeri]|uniref:glycosaminoglycan attachment site n=1 Tax=Pseudomonas gingeri TaxID=117681 RepID=UPI00159F7C65|nr:glycosaminoglycan attachment site [Pseudomonas gingeri]NWA25752.1 glycosaminoglycan attachment site [Pseudomonas gingeri]